jgi:ribonuclease HI/exonuclease III
MPNTCSSSISHPPTSLISIRSWNIDGSFILLMSYPETIELLRKYDFNFFQETHLRPQQHDTVRLPDGYSILCRTRRPKSDFAKSWGGVATVSNSARVPSRLREDLSGPDFMAMQVGDIILYNDYILPESTNWAGDLDRDPCLALASSIALAYAGGFRILIAGDLNARTGSQTPSAYDPPRVSKDEKPPSSRGRFLLKLCNDYDLVFVSGAECFGPSSGDFTSFQGSRSTVIDYVICSRALFSAIRSFAVEPREPGFDHAALVVQLEINSNLLGPIQPQQSRKRKREETSLPNDTKLDKLLIQTLEAGKDDKGKRLRLYGPVYIDTPPIKITIHGACKNAGKHTASAGAGIYFGINSPKNCSLRVWGTQSNARADLTGLLYAIKSSPLRKTLEISTRSEYAIRSVVYYAAKNETCGWRCANGDILKLIFQWIKLRAAPIRFTRLKKTANGHVEMAKKLADIGCTYPRASTPTNLVPPPQNTETSQTLLIEKVTADIPNDSPSQTTDTGVRTRSKFPAPHRGCDRLHDIKERNRQSIMDAPSPGAFWKQVKRLSDPAPVPISVSAHSLKEVFEARLNPPKIMPESFDTVQHKMNNLLANAIPDATEDSSPEGFFSSKWTEDDSAWLKDHIWKHSLVSASGEDAVLYAEIMDIPNDVLILLCNECIKTRDGPSVWFRTAIIGLLKKGKLASMPDSYRIIALESCILKALTLLIHKRITDWANSRGHIPDYQNGFREGYRTNNNPFILRCVKEWARAHGFSIYVAAVDATNAFPSTHYPTLWLKLLEMGMGGAIFDWLRMLYRRMEYYVRHGDSESADFKALIGLLTGDPASPILWNLFMADLIILPDPDDAILSEVRIAIMAQADDILLISLSASGLQRKLNALYVWCSKIFIIVNLIKTVILLFGPIPRPLPEFRLGSNILSIMEPTDMA